MLHFHVVTLFPESIEPYLKTSIIGRAIAAKKIKISYYDPKKFTRDPIRNASRSNGAGKYGRVSEDMVDRRPYGGGPGMVLRPEPFLRAVKKAIGNKKVEIIFFADTTRGLTLACKKYSRRRKFRSDRMSSLAASCRRRPSLTRWRDLCRECSASPSRSKRAASQAPKSTRVPRRSCGKVKNIASRKCCCPVIT